MTVQTTNIDAATGDAVDLTSGDQPFFSIASGVTVQSEEGEGIAADATQNFFVYNHGSIVADGYGLNLQSTNDHFYNYRDGSVFGFDGVTMKTNDMTVVNYGDIAGDEDGIYDDTGGNVISNYGTIVGPQGLDLVGGDSVQNAGNIASNVSNGVAISSGTSTSITTIDNTGTVDGDEYSIFTDGSGALKLSNRGSLDGKVNLTNTGGITFTNGGTIDGIVALGAGTNTFDGRGGSVDHGYIQGGSKTDTIYLGNDGEAENSGSGHDTIYGGTGADVFGFTSYAAANSDTIFGFNVSNDTVQLNHADFTKLTKGATPAFSIGSAATSATDYLFYNSTTGGLYYDPDGSGAGAANLVAKLDPGLHMTAHDFKVI